MLTSKRLIALFMLTNAKALPTAITTVLPLQDPGAAEVEVRIYGTGFFRV